MMTVDRARRSASAMRRCSAGFRLPLGQTTLDGNMSCSPAIGLNATPSTPLRNDEVLVSVTP
jgi:hypothetical protein